MEREILLTGIGGQGVQLAAQVLARAATDEGRHVMTLGTYGGTMRGGNTDSCIVVGDAPISTPPIISRAWAGLGMHPRYWPDLAAKLRPEGISAVNGELFDAEPETAVALSVGTGAIASEVEAPMAGSLVLAGAFASATRLVALDSLIAAMEDALPSYRRQHAEANTRALRAGWDSVAEPLASAWPDEATP